jgi:hypothetical protein
MLPGRRAVAWLSCALRGSRVAQGDLVGLGYVVGLDGSQALAQALASLPQQLEGIAGGTLRSAALRVGPVFLDEMGLQGGGDFVGRLQRVVDGPVPCCVVNHAASIAPSARLVQKTRDTAADALRQFGARVAGNKIVRFLIMNGINVRFVSVRRVSVGAGQKGQ